MPTMKNFERIGIISEKSDREVECTIKNFFSYTEENMSYRSQCFHVWPSQYWHLEICPNARTSENCSGWMSLHLCKNDGISYCFHSEIMCYTFGVKKVNGTVEYFHPQATWKFDGNSETKMGYPQFLKRSVLLLRRSEMAPMDTLTLTITWWKVKHLEYLETLDRLSGNLIDLFISKRGSDATLVVKGKEFLVHKSILSARSPVLATMFEVDMMEKRTGMVEVSDCDPEVFGEFLMYLYSGIITRPETGKATSRIDHLSSNVFQLYKIADMYDVPSLKLYCRTDILENLTTDNVFDVVLLGHQFDEYYVIFKAQEYFNEHFSDITRTPDWEEFLRENTALANELLEGITNQSTSSLRPSGLSTGAQDCGCTESDEETSDWENNYEYNIGKITVKNDHEFEWTIDNFFSYTKEDELYYSPNVLLSDNRLHAWCLKVHPNGSRDFERGYGDCTGWISLHLARVGCVCSPEGVCYNFGLKKIDGTVEWFLPEATREFEEDSNPDVGYPKFLKKSEVSELTSSDSLTLICTLWTTRHFRYLEGLNDLSRDLVDLFLSKRRSDVTLVVKGKAFSAHKSILSARSPILATMFEVDLDEKRTGIIEISDCDPEAFGEFLMYLYSGMVTRTETVLGLYRIYTFSSNLFELYKIAVKYNVLALKSYCSISIAETMNADSMVKSFLFARQFDDPVIASMARWRFNRSYPSTKRNPHFVPDWEKLLSENPAIANELIEGATKEMAKKK